jgi:hypothetical protein
MRHMVRDLAQRIPFPQPIPRGRPADILVRAACSSLIAAHLNDYPGEVAKRNWPDDKDVATLTRAAVVVADTATSGWASQLAQTATADFMLSIGPQSAGSALLKRAISLQFANNNAIKVPSITAASSGAAFVQEGNPAPAQQFSLSSGVTLSPRKFITLAVFTRDIFEHSIPTIESLVRSVLAEDVGLALDAAMFSSTAGDASRPAGLLVGLSPITPAAAGDWSMVTDVQLLAAAVAPVSANSPLLFVASPKQAARMKFSSQLKDVEVFSSSALADKTVLCIAANCLVSAIDPAPRFALSTEATVVMRDDPAQLAVVGTPNVVSAPARSLFQTDSISLKMAFEMSWALRSATGLALMNAVNW